MRMRHIKGAVEGKRSPVRGRIGASDLGSREGSSWIFTVKAWRLFVGGHCPKPPPGLEDFLWKSSRPPGLKTCRFLSRAHVQKQRSLTQRKSLLLLLLKLLLRFPKQSLLERQYLDVFLRLQWSPICLNVAYFGYSQNTEL